MFLSLERSYHFCFLILLSFVILFFGCCCCWFLLLFLHSFWHLLLLLLFGNWCCCLCFAIESSLLHCFYFQNSWSIDWTCSIESNVVVVCMVVSCKKRDKTAFWMSWNLVVCSFTSAFRCCCCCWSINCEGGRQIKSFVKFHRISKCLTFDVVVVVDVIVLCVTFILVMLLL